MISQVEFLTIFCTYDDVSTVSKTLPSILKETSNYGGLVVVHDCSTNNFPEMRLLINSLKETYDFFYISTDPVSMGFARNLALFSAVELFNPTYICMVEDDHGFNPGIIGELVACMKQYYGKVSPNGLRYGLFSTCPNCWGESYVENLVSIDGSDKKVVDLLAGASPMMAGGCNSCFRCAPTVHWLSVLKGYDVDEYPISTFQTSGLNLRNYHKGFTALNLGDGKLSFRVERKGRGFSIDKGDRPYHDTYAKRDIRATRQDD